MIDPHLPAGAQSDPRAPFNKSDEILCRSCDADQINQMWWGIEDGMIAQIDDEDNITREQLAEEIDRAEENFRSQFHLCKECR